MLVRMNERFELHTENDFAVRCTGEATLPHERRPRGSVCQVAEAFGVSHRYREIPRLVSDRRRVNALILF